MQWNTPNKKYRTRIDLLQTAKKKREKRTVRHEEKEKSTQSWISNAWNGCLSQKLKYKAQTRTCTNRMLAYYNIGHFYPNESLPGVDFVFVYLFWIINTRKKRKIHYNQIAWCDTKFQPIAKKKMWEKEPLFIASQKNKQQTNCDKYIWMKKTPNCCPNWIKEIKQFQYCILHQIKTKQVFGL